MIIFVLMLLNGYPGPFAARVGGFDTAEQCMVAGASIVRQMAGKFTVSFVCVPVAHY